MSLTSKKNILVFRIFQFIILSGVFLSLYQFVFNRSLWLDEAMLSLNIVSKTFEGLLHPLDRNQVAPIGFLFIEKLFTIIFGNNEYSLRIFPLLSFYVSIFLFYSFSRKLTKNKLVALAAAAFFSINLSLIYYSSEVKQYTTDILVCILILYNTLNFNSSIKKSLILYTILGIFSIWFSNTAIIILFVCGLYVLHYEFIKKRNWNVFLPILCWIMSFFIYYLFFIHNHPTTGVMRSFWSDYFLPLNPLSKTFYVFIVRALIDIYSGLMKHGPLWIFPTTISLAGIVFLIKEKKHKILYFLFTPIAVHLLISSLKLYPFDGCRLILYLLPLIILIYILGLFYACKFIRLPIIFLPLSVLVLFYPIAKNFPIEREEINKSIAYMASNLQKEDKIYVYYASIHAFEFYQKKYPKIINNEIICGKNHRKDPKKYNSEILKLKGNVWLLFSHVYPFNNSIDNEEKYIINTLRKNGYSILIEKKYSGASVYKITDETICDYTHPPGAFLPVIS